MANVFKGSRHTFSTVLTDSRGRRFLSERTPYEFRELEDNQEIVAKEGDTWQSLAGRYFQGRRRPGAEWWVVADFQASGAIPDPTVPPIPGEVVVIPNVDTIDNKILSERRRRRGGD